MTVTEARPWSRPIPNTWVVPRPIAQRFINVEHQNNDLRNDTNNVDIDLEMTTLAETSLRYQALAQMAGSKLASLKSIVRDSR